MRHSMVLKPGSYKVITVGSLTWRDWWSGGSTDRWSDSVGVGRLMAGQAPARIVVGQMCWSSG